MYNSSKHSASNDLQVDLILGNFRFIIGAVYQKIDKMAELNQLLKLSSLDEY